MDREDILMIAEVTEESQLYRREPRSEPGGWGRRDNFCVEGNPQMVQGNGLLERKVRSNRGSVV